MNLFKITAVLFLTIWLSPVQAALVNGSVLKFTPYDNSGGFGTPADGNGSWMEIAFYGAFGIESFNGLIIGAVQDASGSHSGFVDGTESPTVSTPFDFLGNTGMLETKSAPFIVSAAGNLATVNLSGIGWEWNAIDGIPFYDASIDNGLASIVCGLDCGIGDSYMLDYIGHVPKDHPSNFGEVEVRIHLEGTIAEVPLPAAVWLFIAGLSGLFGFARKHSN